MANTKKKSVRIETLTQTSRRKKDVLLYFGIGGIVSILAVSFFSYSLEVSEKKFINVEKNKRTDSHQIKISTDSLVKESLVIAMENTAKTQAKQIERLSNLMLKSNQEVRADVQKAIEDSQSKQSAELFKIATRMDEITAEVDLRLKESILKQKNELERLKANSSSSTVMFSSEPTDYNNEDIELGFDLLPKIQIKKNPKNESGMDDLLDKIDMVKTKDNSSVSISLPPKPKKVIKTEKDLENEMISKFDDPFSQSNGELDDDGMESNGPIKNFTATNSVDSVSTPSVNKKIKKNRRMTFVSIDTSAVIDTLISDKKIELEEIKKREAEKNTYHVMTGITQGFLITGAYAPVFSEGKSDPIPVLIQAEGDILIANGDTQTLDQCFFLGVAKGNMNSKTADIRLNKISCSLNDGKNKIEGDISGWVVDENGITGIQGELLHKNGAWMAQTFVAGFLQTFSSSMSGLAGGSNSSYSSNGENTTVGDSLIQSGSQSTSDVFAKMGDYYLKMAEQIFPVIEFKPGRTIDIMLQGGTDLVVTDFKSAEIDAIELDLKRLESEKENDLNREKELSKISTSTTKILPIK